MKKKKQTPSKDNKKKKYKSPAVQSLGDIRDVTMGGSPGFGDSGGAPQNPF